MLIRRGPKKWSCVWGWDRVGDKFQPGQCVKGYLDATSATLSPCGKWFSYMVTRERMTSSGYFAPRTYAVVSRVPWLKALAFWNSSSSGILRQNGDSIELEVHPNESGTLAPDVVHPNWAASAIRLRPRTVRWGHPIADGAIYFDKWLSEGWVAMTPWEICPEEECRGIAKWSSPLDVHRIRFEKPIAGTHWKLRMTHWSGCHDDDALANKVTHRGVSFETFAMVDQWGIFTNFPDWISADHDAFRNRVVWTSLQQVWAMNLNGEELGRAEMLTDLADVSGWRTKAPY